MPSEKQLLANRQNALRSTGPHTVEGKAVSSRNAIKHGLRAQTTIIAGEDPDEFHQFRQLLLDDLAPEGAMEVFLADRIVVGFWRLRRAGQMETELFAQINDVQEDRASTGKKADIPIVVNIRKTYACPVSGELVEQENPPADCDSCRRERALLTSAPVQAVDSSSQTTGPADELDAKSEAPLFHLGKVVEQDMTGSNILMRFRFYENQIEASLYRALTELQKLQLVRARIWQMSVAGRSETSAGGNS